MHIELKNVSKKIKDKSLLNNVTFDFQTGDIVGFIGNNGSGKTTTIKTIFQEYVLNGGEILCDGKVISAEDLKTMEFFPDQNNFPRTYKIEDYCWYNFKLSNPESTKKEFSNLFLKLLDALDLSEYKKSKFSQLSSGMQKRALLIFTLINRPKLLVLDEPTANLDVNSRIEFTNLLQALTKQMNLAILITSHNIDELENLINKVVFLENGITVYSEYFNSKKEDLNELYKKYLKLEKPVIDKEKLVSILNNQENI